MITTRSSIQQEGAARSHVLVPALGSGQRLGGLPNNSMFNDSNSSHSNCYHNDNTNSNNNSNSNDNDTSNSNNDNNNSNDNDNGNDRTNNS